MLYIAGYIHTHGGSSSSKSGGGGGLIGISYNSGYVTGDLSSYGGSGPVENGAAGPSYVKMGQLTRKVSRCVPICIANALMLYSQSSLLYPRHMKYIKGYIVFVIRPLSVLP